LIYEMLFGKLPFRGKDGNRKETMSQILHAKLKMPSEITKPTQNILRDFLKRTYKKRLGYGPDGENMIKNHQYFEAYDWKLLYERRYKSNMGPILKAARQKASGNSNSSFSKRRQHHNEPPPSANCQQTFKAFNYRVLVSEFLKISAQRLVFDSISNILFISPKLQQISAKTRPPTSTETSKNWSK
jgi:serine/threonine protein kinase